MKNHRIRLAVRWMVSVLLLILLPGFVSAVERPKPFELFDHDFDVMARIDLGTWRSNQFLATAFRGQDEASPDKIASGLWEKFVGDCAPLSNARLEVMEFGVAMSLGEPDPDASVLVVYGHFNTAAFQEWIKTSGDVPQRVHDITYVESKDEDHSVYMAVPNDWTFIATGNELQMIEMIAKIVSGPAAVPFTEAATSTLSDGVFFVQVGVSPELRVRVAEKMSVLGMQQGPFVGVGLLANDVASWESIRASCRAADSIEVRLELDLISEEACQRSLVALERFRSDVLALIQAESGSVPALAHAGDFVRSINISVEKDHCLVQAAITPEVLSLVGQLQQGSAQRAAALGQRTANRP